MPASNYFIAIVIPEPIQSRIEEIKRELFHRYNLRGALRSPSHITLHRPFEFSREDVLISKLSELETTGPFQLNLQNFGYFEPRVVFINVLPSAPLNALHLQVAGYCKRNLRLFNEADDMRGFHPHVTVAFRDLKKRGFYELKQTFELREFNAGFDCLNFSLLKLGERWEVLRDYRLGQKPV